MRFAMTATVVVTTAGYVAFAVWLVVGLPVAFVCGVRQARYNAAHPVRDYDELTTPPVVVGFAAMVVWPLWLVLWLIYRAVDAVNEWLIDVSGAREVADKAKIEELERDV